MEERLSLKLDLSRRGERLDQFLEGELTGITRSRIKRLIQEGLVTINGAKVKAGYPIKGGEALEVCIPDPPAVVLEPQDIPVDVVYEDDALVVINKQPGLSVHPGAGRADGTLVNALLGRGTTLSSIGSPLRPGIVHRLDKDTSGLMVIAKTDSAHLKLSHALAERTVKRVYWALAWGVPRDREGEINAPLGRGRGDRRKMKVLGRGGRAARTHYRVVWSGGSHCVMHLRLHTGRTHQIRVHLKHLGNPVFGDPDYGGRGRRAESLVAAVRPRAIAALKVLSRQALHAMQLGFVHPETEEFMEFESTPGEDICGAARELQVPSGVCNPGFWEE